MRHPSFQLATPRVLRLPLCPSCEILPSIFTPSNLFLRPLPSPNLFQIDSPLCFIQLRQIRPLLVPQTHPPSIFVNRASTNATWQTVFVWSTHRGGLKPTIASAMTDTNVRPGVLIHLQTTSANLKWHPLNLRPGLRPNFRPSRRTPHHPSRQTPQRIPRRTPLRNP